MPRLDRLLMSGFRSVFAVADRVQICSNCFNFEFDRNKPLGKVCPTILDQDGPPDKTVFVLFLCLDNLGYAKLIKLKQSLVSLDGEMLLFLKKLRSLSIDTEGTITSHSCLIDNNRGLAKFDTSRGPSGNSVKRFIFHESIWDDMPDHEKRPGRETIVSLAFPHGSAGPIIRRDNFIYAFLPMQKQQFKVLISLS